MTQKPSKTIFKRVKKSKNNKFLHITCGQDHFNARESRKITKNKRKRRALSKGFSKTLKQNL
jgi:ribosomal protein L35